MNVRDYSEKNREQNTQKKIMMLLYKSPVHLHDEHCAGEQGWRGAGDASRGGGKDDAKC